MQSFRRPVVGHRVALALMVGILKLFFSLSVFAINSLSFTPLSVSGKYVGSGSNSNGLLFVWDTASGKLKQKLEGHEAGVFSFAWGRGGSSGQQVGSVDKNGKLILWA